MRLSIQFIVFSILLTGTAFGSRWLFTEQEKRAEMPADLGPETIDVSNYPAIQQANYKVFLHKCSACHTPARAINSPYTSAKEWKKYVGLMHNLSHKTWLWGEDRRWIQDFLVYDAQVRKTDQLDTFQMHQKRLRDDYERLIKRRSGDDEEERRENP